MEEWNIKRMPMLHFCLLTTSLKPVRETCDVRRSLLHNVATEWRQTSAQTLHLSAGSDEPRERKQVGRRGDDISSGKEMTEGERARDRKRERLPKCRCKYCFMFLQRHTHLWRGRSLSRVSFCSSLSAVPCTSNYHGAAVWSPMGPREPGPPRIKTIAAGSERKIHAASSHLESVRKNDPWAHIHPGRSWGEERQVRRPSGGGSEAQEAARVRWRSSVLQQVRGPSLLLVWKNPGCSTSLINNSAVCWSAIYFQLCAAAVSCSVEMFIAEGRNQSRQSFLCSHKRPVTL